MRAIAGKLWYRSFLKARMPLACPVGTLVSKLPGTDRLKLRAFAFLAPVGAGVASEQCLASGHTTQRPADVHPVARRANCLRGIAQDGGASGETNPPSSESQRPACAGRAAKACRPAGGVRKRLLSPLGEPCLT